MILGLGVVCFSTLVFSLVATPGNSQLLWGFFGLMQKGHTLSLRVQFTGAVRAL